MIGDRPSLTLVHAQLFDEAARDGRRRGWRTELDKLDTLLSQTEGVQNGAA